MTWRCAGLLSLLCLTLGCASQREQGIPQSTQREQAEEQVMVGPLACDMSVPAQVRAGEPVRVRFQLTNRSEQPLSVLTWRTPLEGTRGNDFHITRDGEELRYQGPMAKRGNPPAEAYVTLAPGASTEAEVDLAPAYGLQQPGRYRIAFRGQVMDVVAQQAEVPRPLDQQQAMAVVCPEVETELVAP